MISCNHLAKYYHSALGDGRYLTKIQVELLGWIGKTEEKWRKISVNIRKVFFLVQIKAYNGTLAFFICTAPDGQNQA
jgi:hypothetical protein